MARKLWLNIHAVTADKPVVFVNSYQHPSVYSFYTHLPSFTFDNINYRKTQYDIWDIEQQLHGKPVATITNAMDPLHYQIRTSCMYIL